MAKLSTQFSALLLISTLMATGCQWVPKSQYAAAETKNRQLVEQVRAQQAEIETLNAHRHRVEDQLVATEDQLAQLSEQAGVDRSLLSDFRRQGQLMNDALRGARGGVPSPVERRLAELAQRYPNLRYDPQTGVSKLQTDLLFDTGDANLQPNSRRALDELADILTTTEGQDLRIVVAGHTDDRQISKQPTREQYPDNWHLSTARSLAVCEYLNARGVRGDRMGVAGFAEHQPIAANGSPEKRQKNRRVEVFLMAPDTPVVGWTDTMTSLY